MFLSYLSQMSEQAIAKGSLGSALNPLMLFMGITIPAGGYGVVYFPPGYLQIISIILTLTGPVLFAVAYLFFYV